MTHTILVSTSELAAHLRDWRIFDCRHDLMSPRSARASIAKGHIPGAVFAHLDRDLSAPKSGKNGRHPLPDPEAFGAWLGRAGLRREDQVICYDGANGLYASRLWWMLRWVGHRAVAVLDGGFAKWKKRRPSITTEVPALAPTDYPIELQEERAVGVRTVHRRLGQQPLLDARAAPRWRGETEPIDPEAGRIPGAATGRAATTMRRTARSSRRRKLEAEFEKVLAGRRPGDVVNYCGSGVSACHNLLAMEVAGLTGARLYAGSWSEWIADPRVRARRARNRTAGRDCRPGFSGAIAASGAHSDSSAKSSSEPTWSANEKVRIVAAPDQPIRHRVDQGLRHRLRVAEAAVFDTRYTPVSLAYPRLDFTIVDQSPEARLRRTVLREEHPIVRQGEIHLQLRQARQHLLGEPARKEEIELPA
jgi:thiosulfate/3-mercaptopyruvate sulfurtransferase